MEENSTSIDNNLSKTTSKIDFEVLNDAQIIRSRKKWAWWTSWVGMILTWILIIAFIAIVGYSFFNISMLNSLKSFWHLYLISIVALTTLFSGFMYLNRSTWVENKIDKHEDLLTEIISRPKELFFKIKD